MKTPVLCLVAKSGTGKTSLLEKLIALLKQQGFRVGAMKHDAHRFEIDREGKDSWRLTRAGADTMVICSPAKLAMVKMNPAKKEPDLLELVDSYFPDVDIVLAEGFKQSRAPKIEVHRKERSSELLCRGENHDENLIAVVSDERLDVDVPLFDINDEEGVCNFIMERFFPSFK